MTLERILRSRACLLYLAAVFVLVACGDDNKTTNSGAGGAKATAGSSSSIAGSATTAGAAGSGGNAVALAAAGTTQAGAAGGNAAGGCAPAIETEGFVDVPANDPAIRYVGRVVKKPDSVSFAFPAVQIETTFTGDAIDMRLRDNGLSPLPTATNVYWVIIDGIAQKLQVCEASTVYPLARNLGPGPHSLTIVKRTESSLGGHGNAGKGEFLGFRVRTGTNLTPVADVPERRMEFVGDSITCGYGNDISTTEPDQFKFTSLNEDGWNAYGAVTARALNADYVAVAASGRGVIRNYGGFVSPVVPKMYETIFPDDSASPTWDHSLYSPDVVVVNLGTNDFSPGIAADQYEAHRASFRQGYVDFVTRIREVHPTASIVLAVGPMLSDSYPEGYNALTSVKSDVTAVVEARHAANDVNVHFFEFEPQTSPYGEDWHPTLATHRDMAESLATFVAKLRGW